MASGRVAESLHWVAQMLDAGEAYHDPDLLITGHLAAVSSYFWLGELAKTRQHAAQVLVLYAEGRHAHLVNALNHDPKTFSLSYMAAVDWMLGYPEQAVRTSEVGEAHARLLGYPFDLGFALTIGATVFDHLGLHDGILKRAREAERLGQENSLPVLTSMLAPSHSGIALIHSGQIEPGIAALKAGLSVWEECGGKTVMPYLKSTLAEGLAQIGEPDRALDLIGEVFAQIERPGWQERHYYAEAFRIKASLLLQQGDLEGAERSYIASLDWARRQQAKSWELRTATSYAWLMRDRGRISEAYELLAPVYNWFTEGFGTKDLKEAKALLAELRESAHIAPAQA